jgi:hypothetical protein
VVIIHAEVGPPPHPHAGRCRALTGGAYGPPCRAVNMKCGPVQGSIPYLAIIDQLIHKPPGARGFVGVSP